MLPNIRFQLEKIGEEYIAALIRRLVSLDKVATGTLIDSLDYDVVETADKVILEIISVDYLQWVDKGRLPGSMPPVDAIERWVRVKGITAYDGKSDRQLAWAIAKKIERDGIPATNVMELAENDIYNRIQLLITLGLDRDIEFYISRI